MARIFLTVRDPYERLWDVYMNTLWLPDKWGTVGVFIEKNRTTADKQTDSHRRCGMDVTFVEFIQYVLLAYEVNRSLYK